jgi:hypothetical protein
MKKLKYVLIAVILGAGIGWWWYKDAAKHPDPLMSKDKVELYADSFYNFYVQHEDSANKLYLDKTLSLSGVVGSVASSVNQGVNRHTIYLQTSVPDGRVSCEMDTTQNEAVEGLKTGQKIKLVGFCNGLLMDEIQIDRCKLAH